MWTTNLTICANFANENNQVNILTASFTII